MPMHETGFTTFIRHLCAAAVAGLGSILAASAGPSSIELPSATAYPESITSTSDGTIYVSSFADGGVFRAKPGQARAEPWIAPGAYGTRSTFGVLADEGSSTLWVCSNDASAFNAPGPSMVTGSFLKGFDLSTGEGKTSAVLPGARTLCNDIAVGPDGSVYVTNSFAPEILRLPPGGTELTVWLTDPLFMPPKDGAGLDGIAFGADGNIYVNTFTTSMLLRIDVASGVAQKVTKLAPSRPVSFPDALRHSDGNSFLMIEGAGSLDRVTILDDTATVETVAKGYVQPTGVTISEGTAFVAEGQLSSLVHPSDGQGPRLPFRAFVVPLSAR